MKETKLEIPAGCEVDKIETQEGHIVVTFREKERQLPKSWDEFEKINPIKVEYVTYDSGEIAYEKQVSKRYLTTLLHDRATAEAVLALCQLIQLRNCYNGDWVPNWRSNICKYVIYYKNHEIVTSTSWYTSELLYFKTKELCDEFLRNFRPLIEKLKPLHGIKEGGEE